MIRYVVLLILIISPQISFSQSYTYAYVDPCTKIVKQVTIPSGQQNIAITYYGQLASFSQADFTNGNFINWMNSTAAINSNKPCDQLVNQTTTQTNLIVASNIISTLTNVTAVATMSSQLSGSIASVSSGGVSTTPNSTTNRSNSGTTNSGGTGTETSSSTEGQPSSQNSGETETTSSGGTTNSIANAAESSTSSESSSSGSGGGKGNSRARVGTLIGTGDIVAIRSAEDDQRDQFRFTGSMTKSNTDNTFAKGLLGNFTTAINNSNITLYSAWNIKKYTLIFANSSMINSERDFFNTTTLLGSKRFNKLSLMGGANLTFGKLGKTPFNNLSAVGGGFYLFTPGKNKKVTGTILLLGVYSPFTQFYEGRWWDSNILIVPFSSWDYSITKKFKYNISFSGTYEWNKNMLNYQILTGGKILL